MYDDILTGFLYVATLGIPGSPGVPEEFAGFVFHLSTMQNISGQTINLDGRILF